LTCFFLIQRLLLTNKGPNAHYIWLLRVKLKTITGYIWPTDRMLWMPTVYFNNILWAAFALIFLCQKLQSQTITRQNLCKTLPYEKVALKILMKLRGLTINYFLIFQSSSPYFNVASDFRSLLGTKLRRSFQESQQIASFTASRIPLEPVTPLQVISPIFL